MVNRFKVGLLSLMILLLVTACGSSSSSTSSPTTNTPASPPPENRAPVIQLLGDAQISVNLNDSFIDPGVTANDAEDGDISEQVTVSGSVNTSGVGAYSLVYSVTDSAGLSAQISRMVTVLEITDPSSNVQAALVALSRVNGVSPETIYFSAQDSTCSNCTDIFGLNTQLADAWSELSYYFSFDDADAGTFAATGNSRNSQSSGSPRSFHTFHCLGSSDPNWLASEQRCVFDVGVRAQAKNGDYADEFIRVSIQPLLGDGGYYQDADIWCVSGESNFSECPHNDSSRHITDSPMPGSYDERLLLFARGSNASYAPICVGVDERNVTVATYGSGSRPLVQRIAHGTRPGSCLTTLTDASIATLAVDHAPRRDTNSDLVDGYAFNATFTGLRVGSINNGPTYHLANFHDLDMDWSGSATYNGEIVVHTHAWNCKNSATLSCANVPYSMFGSFTSISSKSNAANLAPVNIACYDGCGATNFVFAEIETDRAYEHNARLMGLWGGIFSNNWFRGNHIGGNGGKERLSVRPGEAIGSLGGTFHDLDKNPELLDGSNNYRANETTGDYYNRYNVAVDNIFNQVSHDNAHESAAMLHLGGNFTGEYGNQFLADDSGDLVFQTQFTGRYKVVRNTSWAQNYPYCSLRTGFYADDTLYNDASTIFVESPASCGGSYDWPANTAPLSYGTSPQQ